MQDPKTGFPIRKKESDMTKQRLFVASAFGMLIAGVLVFATEPVYDSQEDSGEYVKAWDVYLLFPPGAEWKDEPPAPSYWMHQLPLDRKRRFNGDTLAAEVKKLLHSEQSQTISQVAIG